MILAAGRGERMRPLTDKTPKPLLRAGGKALIDLQLDRLVAVGIRCLVINVSHLGDQIERHVGLGDNRGCCVHYSHEGEALETGGGIFKALPFLRDPFLVVNSDVWTDLDFSTLSINDEDLAHLVLVDNPSHHPTGDFSLEGNRLRVGGSRSMTFSGIGIYRKALFSGCRAGKFPLAPILREAMARNRVGGQRHGGGWMDIGTPRRLEELNTRLSQPTEN